MIGKEIADALSPIIMWLVIGGVVLLVLGGIWRQAKRGAIAQDDLGKVAQAEKENRSASENLKTTRRRFRDSFLDGWMRKPKDK